MNRIFTLLLLLASLAGAQPSWQPIGANDFNQASLGHAGNGSTLARNRMVIRNGVVYLLQVESEFNTKTMLVLNKYANGHWEHIPTFWIPINSGPTYYDFTVDNSGTPLLLLNDPTDNGKVALKKYDGTNWVNVGGQALSAASAGQSVRLALGTDNLPVVLFAEGGGAALKKFDGTNWITIPSAELLPYGLLSIDQNNNPVVAYSSSTQTFVKRFTGTLWEEVGGLTGFPDYPGAICVDDNNTIFLITGNTFRKFDGTSWSTLPTPPNFTQAYSFFTRDANNALYVTFTAPSMISHYTYKLENNNWVTHHSQMSYGAISVAFDGNEAYEAFIKSDYFPLVIKKNGGNWNWLGDQTTMVGQRHGSVLSNDLPVVSYVKTMFNSPSKVYVSECNALGVWTESPQAISEANGFNSVMGKDASGNIYIAYLNAISGSFSPELPTAVSKVTVKKKVGNSWQPVGAIDFSLEAGLKLGFEFNHANQPHVIYKSGRIHKFNGTAWELVGGSAFNGDLNAQMAFNAADELYVAHDGISVKKRNGNGWETIDAAGLSAFTNAKLPQILFGTNDDLYIAFVDAAKDIHVMELVAGNWTQIGSTIPTQSGCSFLELKLDVNGLPFVFFNQKIDEFRDMATVKRFNGTDWEEVGVPYFSSGQTSEGNLSFTSDNMPVVTYMAPNGLYAKYFGEAGSLDVGQNPQVNKAFFSIAPNPAHDILTIYHDNPVERVDVFDVSGKLVATFLDTHDLDVSRLKTGIYFVKAFTQTQIFDTKFIKK